MEDIIRVNGSITLVHITPTWNLIKRWSVEMQECG